MSTDNNYIIIKKIIAMGKLHCLKEEVIRLLKKDSNISIYTWHINNYTRHFDLAMTMVPFYRSQTVWLSIKRPLNTRTFDDKLMIHSCHNTSPCCPSVTILLCDRPIVCARTNNDETAPNSRPTDRVRTWYVAAAAANTTMRVK